jgi:hypothetical protein
MKQQPFFKHDPVLRDLTRELYKMDLKERQEDAVDDRAAEIEVEISNRPHDFALFLLDLIEDQDKTMSLSVALRDILAAVNCRYATGDAGILKAANDAAKFLNQEIKRSAREEAEFELTNQH